MSLQLEVDPGEAEAIALALEAKADLLLIDERKGRRLAQALGCRIVGILGILIEAKQKKLLLEVKPMMDALIQQAGFRISQELYAEVLRVAGE